MIRRTPKNNTEPGDHSVKEPIEKHFDDTVDENRDKSPDRSEETTTRKTEVVPGGEADDFLGEQEVGEDRIEEELRPKEGIADDSIDLLSTTQDTETVIDPLTVEEDPLGGRVVDTSDDTSEIIVPEGPSKLEGEVLLVRRADSEDLPDASEFKVKRVSASRAEQQEEKEDRGFLYSFLDTVRFISLGLLVGMLLVVFVVQRNDVYGSSMEPTMYDGDAVFVEMISVYLDHYRRGDIVTIDAEGMDGYYHKEYIIKRVIGLPGETVTIFDGLVYINGNLLIEPYLADGLMTYVSEGGVANGYHQVTLGPNEYYCMGDNRGASNDSRRIGPISVERIKSHVIARIYPFDEMKIY